MNDEIPPSKITRRHLLKGTAAAMLAAQSASLMAGIKLKRAESGRQPAPAGPTTEVPFTVTGTAAGTIPPAFAGLAYPKEKMLGNLFTASNSTLIGVLKRLGQSILRFGGNQVDWSVWTPKGAGGIQGQVAPADVDNLAAFLKAVNWKCLYGINLAGPSPWKTTPTLAAEEAAYVAEKLGPYLYSIEIGNEPDFYGNPGQPFAGNWSLQQYLTLWNSFHDAIALRTPGIPISGPASAGDPLTWTIPFAQAQNNERICMLTQHYYVGNSLLPTSTVNKLLQTSLNQDLVRELSALHATAVNLNIPLRMNEGGTYFNTNPTNIAGSYTAALWGLDYMFICAQGGAVGVNFEGGGNVPGYPPILNDSNSVTTICPLYYAMLLFDLAGTGTVLATEISPGALNVTGYAVNTDAGGLSIVLVNKEATDIQVPIELPQSYTSGKLIELTQCSPGATTPDLMAASGVTIQGAEVLINGNFYPGSPYWATPTGNQLSCYVPALSAVLVTLS